MFLVCHLRLPVSVCQNWHKRKEARKLSSSILFMCLLLIKRNAGRIQWRARHYHRLITDTRVDSRSGDVNDERDFTAPPKVEEGEERETATELGIASWFVCQQWDLMPVASLQDCLLQTFFFGKSVLISSVIVPLFVLNCWRSDGSCGWPTTCSAIRPPHLNPSRLFWNNRKPNLSLTFRSLSVFT